MGNLKPGATYIYERNGKKVYAREMGADPDTKILIGYDWDGSGHNLEQGLEKLEQEELWAKIRYAAKTNKTLQHAIEECIIIYKLSEDYKDV
jgi:hypothetical protein